VEAATNLRRPFAGEKERKAKLNFFIAIHQFTSSFFALQQHLSSNQDSCLDILPLACYPIEHYCKSSLTMKVTLGVISMIKHVFAAAGIAALLAAPACAETITATFTTPDGGVTAGLYHNEVQILPIRLSPTPTIC
jgi:hypothetical protein